MDWFALDLDEIQVAFDPTETLHQLCGAEQSLDWARQFGVLELKRVYRSDCTVLRMKDANQPQVLGWLPLRCSEEWHWARYSGAPLLDLRTLVGSRSWNDPQRAFSED